MDRRQSPNVKARIRKAGVLPSWLRRRLPAGGFFQHTDQVLSTLGLDTICTHANCPNRGECWARGTATVLILGNICTRNCRFCSVAKGRPEPPDPTEPSRLAEMAKRMHLKYLVVTSVNRDDLPDGGAEHFRLCLDTVRGECPDMKFELLLPDFVNCQNRAVAILGPSMPFVFAHNVETVPSLYRLARSGGNYERSLNLLRMAKDAYTDVQTKSSIMLGLGETDDEVERVLRDLRAVGCDRLTIGQYLKPSKDSLDVVEYIRLEKFDEWKQRAVDLGFSWVCASPFARSSYLAEQDSKALP
jgi:lipoic acid synthetase